MISRVGSAVANTSSLTPSWSGAGAGEIEVAWAFRTSAATAITVPSGWTSLLSATGNTCAGVLAYRFCPDNSNVASGTFTGATQLIIARYKGVKGLGNVLGSNASGTSVSYPGLTAVQTAGNSWYLGAGGHRTATNIGVAPTGMTNFAQVGASGSSFQSAMHDTNGGVSSWSTQSATVNASSGHESMTLELLADNGAWSIYNSSGSSGWSLSTENKVAVSTANPANTNCIRTFTGHSTGKWYFLARLLAYGSTSDLVTGWCTATASMTVWPGGANNNGIAFGFNSAGTDNQWINHTAANNSAVYNHPAAANDFFHFCIDLDSGLTWVRHDSMTDWNNNGSASPDGGAGGFAYTDVLGQVLFPFTGTGNNGSQFAINTTDISARPANASSFTAWDSDPVTTISGSSSITEGADALSGTGTTVITGTASPSEAADTLSASGTTTLTGTGSITEGADTLTAAGSQAPISGTASITEADDSLLATGTLKIAAAASPTEGDDSTAATGTTVMRGVVAVTEAGDALTALGTVAVRASAGVTEADDLTTSSAKLAIGGVANGLEADDAIGGTSALKIAATASVTEGGDSLLAAGISVQAGTGSLNLIEADDTLAAAAATTLSGAGVIQEAGDTISASATLNLVGMAVITESDDLCAGAGTSKLSGMAVILEGDDFTAAFGTLDIVAVASIQEQDDTLLSASRSGALYIDPALILFSRRRRTEILAHPRRTALTTG